MENKKKMAFNVVFLILVFAGTIYGVFHGEDLGEIARILKTVNLLWLIPGFICVIVFIWGESIIIYYMMRTLGIKRKKWTFGGTACTDLLYEKGKDPDSGVNTGAYDRNDHV